MDTMRFNYEIATVAEIRDAATCKKYFDGIQRKIKILEDASKTDAGGPVLSVGVRNIFSHIAQESVKSVQSAGDAAALASAVRAIQSNADLQAIVSAIDDAATIQSMPYASGPAGALVRANLGKLNDAQFIALVADRSLSAAEKTNALSSRYDQAQELSMLARWEAITKTETPTSMTFTSPHGTVIITTENRAGVMCHVVKRTRPNPEERTFPTTAPDAFKNMVEHAVFLATDTPAPTVGEMQTKITSILSATNAAPTALPSEKSRVLGQRVKDLKGYMRELQKKGVLEFREVFDALTTAEQLRFNLPKLTPRDKASFDAIIARTPETGDNATKLRNLGIRRDELMLMLSPVAPTPLPVASELIREEYDKTVVKFTTLQAEIARLANEPKVTKMKADIDKILNDTKFDGKTGAELEKAQDARIKALEKLKTDYDASPSPVPEAQALVRAEIKKFNDAHPGFKYTVSPLTGVGSGGLPGGGEGGRDVAESWDRRSEVKENVVFKDEATLREAVLARFVKEKTAHLNVPITPELIGKAKQTLEKFESKGRRMLCWGAIALAAGFTGGLAGSFVASALLAKGAGLLFAGATGLLSGIGAGLLARQGILNYAGKKAGSDVFGMTYQEHMRSAAALNRASKEFHPSASWVPSFWKKMFGMNTTRDEYDHYAHSRAALGSSTEPMTVSFKRAMEAWEQGHRNEGKRQLVAGLIGGSVGALGTVAVVDYGLGQFGFKRPASMIVGGIGGWWNGSGAGRQAIVDGVPRPKTGAPIDATGPKAGNRTPQKWICFDTDGRMRVVTPETVRGNTGGLRAMIQDPQWELSRKNITGFGGCDKVSGSRGGFEAFVKRSVPGVNWDCLGFGAGVKSPFTDLFMGTLARDEYLSRTFFSWPDGMKVPKLSNGMIDVSAMESNARRCGRGLDFRVLNEVGNGNKRMINLMMERAGGGERGELMRQTLKVLNQGVMANPRANMWVNIAR